jgi:hypothetical protein
MSVTVIKIVEMGERPGLGKNAQRELTMIRARTAAYGRTSAF